MTLIERMARAACDAAGYDWHEEGDGSHYPTGGEWRLAARAALAAAREPTEAMVKAADESDYECYEGIEMSRLGIDPAIPYRAMIDAALAEEG